MRGSYTNLVEEGNGYDDEMVKVVSALIARRES
jgi:hypothetical protein